MTSPDNVIRFGDVEIVANITPNTLTVRKCSTIPATLLPFHISVDTGAVQFEWPYAVCPRYGCAVNLRQACVALFSVLDGCSVLPNRIRFHRLETYWFPFLESFAPTETRSNVVSLARGKLRLCHVDAVPYTPSLSVDIARSTAQREYVFLTGDVAGSRWRTHEIKEPATHPEIAPDFTLKRAQLIHAVDPFSGKSKVISYDAFMFGLQRTPKQEYMRVVTLVEPDQAFIVSLTCFLGCVTILGLDSTNSVLQDTIDSFVNSYTQELCDHYPSVLFTHDIHVLPGACSEKVVQRMQRHGAHLQFIESDVSDEVVRAQRLADIGYAIARGKWTWVRPLVMADTGRESYVIAELVHSMERLWCHKKSDDLWKRLLSRVNVFELEKTRVRVSKRARTMLA